MAFFSYSVYFADGLCVIRDRGKLLVLLCTYFWGPFLQIYISMVCGNGKEKTKALDEKNTIRNLY